MTPASPPATTMVEGLAMNPTAMTPASPPVTMTVEGLAATHAAMNIETSIEVQRRSVTIVAALGPMMPTTAIVLNAPAMAAAPAHPPAPVPRPARAMSLRATQTKHERTPVSPHHRDLHLPRLSWLRLCGRTGTPRLEILPRPKLTSRRASRARR
jgi:hypothetical protein